ncbi:MAG TPA: hypothetical protein VM074_10595 [Solimonas sp.]|nr:hypothetical protein [Solimonas sp.]
MAIANPARPRKKSSERPRALSFEDDPRPIRTGDLLSPEEVREKLPPTRGRLAGRTGGEVNTGRPTADDLSPETLLDDDPSQEPSALRRRVPADSRLGIREASMIGAGLGPDEAEAARRDPIKPEEHRELRRRAARSGGSILNLEPHESAAGSPARARYRKPAKAKRPR